VLLVLYAVEKISCKYRNAGEKLVRHWHFYRQSTSLVRRRHSGIRVCPVTLVTDQSGIAQIWKSPADEAM
jgi:hypothetical protein